MSHPSTAHPAGSTTSSGVTTANTEENVSMMTQGAARSLLVDSVSGFVSGVAALCVSQPFDTVRVRAQTIDSPAPPIVSKVDNTVPKQALRNFFSQRGAATTSWTGGHLYNTINGTFQGYGVMGFYRGIVPPLLATSIISTTVFSTFEIVKRRLYEIQQTRHAAPTSMVAMGSSWLLSQNLQLYSIFLAGSCSGFFSSFLTTPLHRVKVQLQTTTSYQYQQHTVRSTVFCARRILRQEGLRGMYKGWSAQALSETIGRGVYFGTYEAMKRLHRGEDLVASSSHHGRQSHDAPLSIRMLCGAVSGIVGWTVVYPIDVLKNRIQAEKISSEVHHRTMGSLLRTGARLYRNHGASIFYRGLSVMLVRAFPVSAIALPTYDVVHGHLESTL